MQPIGKIMMYAGFLLFIVGALLHWGSKYLPLGRLPGDFSWQHGNFGIYFPLASSIIISIILTILLNLWGRR